MNLKQLSALFLTGLLTFGTATTTVWAAQYKLTALTSEGGCITPSGINAGAHSNYTFSINADAGYFVQDILVDGVSVGAADEYHMKDITADHTITAVFEKIQTPAPEETVLPYTDIKDSPFQEAIIYTTEKGLFYGTTETTFSPEEGMTRGMFAVVMARLFGADLESYTYPIFSDVTADRYDFSAINWAYASGILKGAGDGTFVPDAPLSREAAASLAYRISEKIGGWNPLPATDLTAYTDASTVSPWAVSAVDFAITNNILPLREGNLQPTADIARGEIAYMLKAIQNTNRL